MDAALVAVFVHLADLVLPHLGVESMVLPCLGVGSMATTKKNDAMMRIVLTIIEDNIHYCQLESSESKLEYSALFLLFWQPRLLTTHIVDGHGQVVLQSRLPLCLLSFTRSCFFIFSSSCFLAFSCSCGFMSSRRCSRIWPNFCCVPQFPHCCSRSPVV